MRQKKRPSLHLHRSGDCHFPHVSTPHPSPHPTLGHAPSLAWKMRQGWGRGAVLLALAFPSLPSASCACVLSPLPVSILCLRASLLQSLLRVAPPPPPPPVISPPFCCSHPTLSPPPLSVVCLLQSPHRVTPPFCCLPVAVTPPCHPPPPFCRLPVAVTPPFCCLPVAVTPPCHPPPLSVVFLLQSPHPGTPSSFCCLPVPVTLPCHPILFLLSACCSHPSLSPPPPLPVVCLLQTPNPLTSAPFVCVLCIHSLSA